MPDIASLGLSIDTRPILDGTKALDGLGDAASRVEPKVDGAAKAVDGFGNATANVWRRGTDAAKGIDALGEATARTGQRATVSNGAMNDTAKIMQAQAEPARATAQAQAALGLSTTQLTLGQQLFIDKLRDQVAVLGMSRSQLLAYQAAQLGVTNETSKLIAEMKKFEDGVKAAADAKAKATEKANQLTDAIKLLAAGYALFKVADYIKDSALLAARYETLGVVMEVIGRTAGYTKTQMLTATEAIAQQGITMTESRQSAIKLVQAHIDLKEATTLARIAQDAAVIGNINSSEAFDRLVNGIARGNVLILRNLGINVNLQSAYQQTADSLGKSTKELTENERVQARLNAVKELGIDINGTYIASMDTAGKQLKSMQRYTEDLKTVIGETFNEVLTVSVMGLTDGLKDANAEMKGLSADGTLKEWGRDLTNVLVGIVNAVSNIITMTKLAGVEAAHATQKGGLGYAPKDASFLPRLGAELFAKMGFDSSGPTQSSEKLYQDEIANLTGQLNKFSSALDVRRATTLAKEKAAAEEKLKVDSDYAKAATDILLNATNAGVVAQEIARKKVIELHRATYEGTPTYRDTEGREPKAKVDQVESTELADYIKRQEGIAAAAKHSYAELSKLDDMYHKAGELSDQQYYDNKRKYSDDAAAAQISAYDKEIAAINAYHNSTKDEAAKHAKDLHDIEDKRAAAVLARSAEGKLFDEQERLRKDAIIKASEAAAVKEITSINAQVAAVEMQIRTYNMLPAAKTAVAIADLEEQAAALAGFENSEKTIELINQKIEALNRLRSAQEIATKQDTGSDVAKAKELLDILTAVDNATKSAAASMADSFGRVGSAIGGLTTALSGYAVQQQAIAAQLTSVKADPKNSADKVARAEIAASHASAQAQIKSYGDMAHAAKGFFKENSTGYKVMEGAEKAFRAYEMAMAVESMVKKIFFKEGEVAANVALNGTKLAGEAATTAASTGLAATEASAWGITAVVKALASLPFPLNLAAGAATLAAVVAIGAKMFGGTGGSSASVSEQRQAAAGTGSVFGDSSAKSDSIARSIELAATNSSIELTHTAGMLRALISIESSIANLGNILIRSGDVGTKTPATQNGAAANFFASSAVNGIVGGFLANTLGKVGNAIFGGNVHTLDTGLTADKTTVGQARESGITAYQYTDTKRDGGLFHKDHYEPYVRALGGEANDQFSKVITGMAEGVRQAGTLLGQSGDDFNSRLDSFVVDLGKISVKDLKGDEIQAALETVFSKLGDDMAQFAVAGLGQFQRVGEGYLETLTRVAVDYANLDSILAATGTTFGATGLSSIAARERLIELTGGIDKLASKSSAFADNFLTEAERLAPVQKYVTEQLGAMGLASVTTRDQFKATVLGLANSGALATEAGAKQYAGMLALADAFAKTHAATEDLTKSEQAIADERKDLQQQLNELTMTSVQLLALQRAGIDDSNKALFDQVQAAKAVASAKDALSSSYDKESSALKTLIDAKLAEAAATRKQIDSLKLGALSTLSPEAKYAEAKRQFDAATGADKTAMASTFLDASRAYNASSSAYAADYDKVQKALSKSASAAAAAAAAAQAELAIMTAQVSSLVTINASVLSVRDAMADLTSILSASAQGGAAGASGGGSWGASAASYFPGTTVLKADIASGAVWSEADMGAAYMRAHPTGGGAPKFALGGIFTNGIVSQPTNFNIGQMGEAGSEAIMPLVRTPQGLGVRSIGNGGASDSGDVAGLLREVLAELKNVTAELGADKTQRGAVAGATLAKLDRVADKLDGNKRELARAS